MSPPTWWRPSGAFAGGLLEDRIGPKTIILVSLGGLVVSAIVLLFASGSTMFWIFGLALCLWVGPAQASSRSFLARLAHPGQEGQLFGLYATTGRAVSFLAPGLFALFSRGVRQRPDGYPRDRGRAAGRWGVPGLSFGRRRIVAAAPAADVR